MDDKEIDTEMYLRDGAPHATVCKVQLKDGRIGIGVFRQVPMPGRSFPSLEQAAADRAALDDALENIPEPVDPTDMQEGLCTKCRAHPSNHHVGTSQRLCCACYVADGHPPADWHTECMRAYLAATSVAATNLLCVPGGKSFEGR